MAEFQIKTCTRERYNEMFKFLVKAFSFEDPYWFFNNIPNCCPPLEKVKETDIKNHIITLLDDKIVGSIGVYPETWVVSYCDVFITLKMAGIGQVAADAKYRGKGIMSGMLKEAISRMESEGIEGSWLFGERARYYNFGWEYGGSNIKYSFSQKTLDRLLASDIPGGRPPVNADIDKLNICYEKLPSYIKRGTDKWECHISRSIYQVSFLDNEHGIGYFIYNSKNPREIVEISGDEASIRSLLKNHAEKHSLNEIIIYYPAANTGLGSFFYKHASWFAANSLFQFRVTTGDLLDKLTPIVELQAKDCGIDIVKVKERLAKLNHQEKKAICDRLFGYAYMPWDMEGFQFVSPMCIWTSHLEDI